VIDKDTFHNASKWLVEAYKHMGPLPPTVIIGNKIDLRRQDLVSRAVTTEDGIKFTQFYQDRLNIPAIFWETSALTGQNINDMFSDMIDLMIKYRKADK
jgi:GTPase SAR1 family protein